MPTAVWDSAKQHDSLSLMDRDELSSLAYRYYLEGVINQEGGELLAAFLEAESIAQRSSLGPLTPHYIEELLTATSHAQSSVAMFKHHLNYLGKNLEAK